MDDDVAASLASITTTEGTAALIGSADEPYPFDQIQGYTEQERILRRWLLGNAIFVADREPLGGAALVTGFRGVGKTTIVNKVLFDVGLAALHNLHFKPREELVSDDQAWGPFSRKDLKVALDRLRDRPGKKDRLRLYVPIRINVSNSIDHHELMRRTLRRTYLTLSRYQVGHFCPELMRRVRLAYIRSLGGLEIEVSKRIQESIGVKLDKLSTLEVTANQELEFAETIKLVTNTLSVEEGEDELLDLGHDLVGARFGQQSGIFENLRRGLGRAVNDAFARVSTFLVGAEGRQVHLVYVLDELDKLDSASAGPEPSGRISLNGEFNSYAAGEGGVFFRHDRRVPVEGTLITQHPEVRDPKLRDAVDVIKQLKILFSSRAISAVVISGTKTEEIWQDEIATPEVMLRSIFGTHVYVPQLTLPGIKNILRNADEKKADDEAALSAVWTRGRFKSLLRILPVLAASRSSPSALAQEIPLRSKEALEKLGRCWGEVSPASIPSPSLIALQQLVDKAESIEDLIRALGPYLPATRHNEFGLDLLRTILACCVTEMMVPTETDSTSNSKELADVLARFVARDLVPVVLKRLRTLVAWQVTRKKRSAAKEA